MIHIRTFNAMAAVLAAVALCGMAVPSVSQAESEDESQTETTTTVTSGPAYLQVCTAAWANAPAYGLCATDGAVSRHTYNDAHHPGRCRLKGVNCNLGGIQIQGTSFVHTFHDYEFTLNLSPEDTEALDICIGVADDDPSNEYYGELKAGCTADETDSSTAVSQGIVATEFFILEQAAMDALSNPDPDARGSEGSEGNDSITQSMIEEICTDRWTGAPAEAYCSADVGATANRSDLSAFEGFSDADFTCVLNDVDCSIDITVESSDETSGEITTTDYTVDFETTEFTAEPQATERLDLCLEAEDDPEDDTSGFKASLQDGGCVYSASWAEENNLPKVQ